jgi:hypothetical protein
MMNALAAPICVTCGTQFPPAHSPPEHCAICYDERQYVPAGGQRWTDLHRLQAGYANTWRRLEPDLYAIRTEPAFAIGQRALLVRSPTGNVLWDCIALLDDATHDLIAALGGINAIAISHPHYYTTMVEWAHAFDTQVFLHAADRSWVMRPDPTVRFWEDDTLSLHDGLMLVRCGGHFAGGTVLHWPAGAAGAGVLLSGDILQVLPDRRHVSFMRSYPNLIPLSAAAVRSVARAVEMLPFDRVYGAFQLEILTDAKEAVRRSVDRYVRWVTEHHEPI